MAGANLAPGAASDARRERAPTSSRGVVLTLLLLVLLGFALRAHETPGVTRYYLQIFFAPLRLRVR